MIRRDGTSVSTVLCSALRLVGAIRRWVSPTDAERLVKVLGIEAAAAPDYLAGKARLGTVVGKWNEAFTEDTWPYVVVSSVYPDLTTEPPTFDLARFERRLVFHILDRWIRLDTGVLGRRRSIVLQRPGHPGDCSLVVAARKGMEDSYLDVSYGDQSVYLTFPFRSAVRLGRVFAARILNLWSSHDGTQQLSGTESWAHSTTGCKRWRLPDCEYLQSLSEPGDGSSPLVLE